MLIILFCELSYVNSYNASVTFHFKRDREAVNEKSANGSLNYLTHIKCMNFIKSVKWEIIDLQFSKR